MQLLSNSSLAVQQLSMPLKSTSKSSDELRCYQICWLMKHEKTFSFLFTQYKSAADEPAHLLFIHSDAAGKCRDIWVRSICTMWRKYCFVVEWIKARSCVRLFATRGMNWRWMESSTHTHKKKGIKRRIFPHCALCCRVLAAALWWIHDFAKSQTANI